MSSQFLRSSPLSLHISDLFTPLIYSSSPAEYAHLTNLTSLDSLNPQCFSFYPSEYNALRCAWRACFLRLPQKIPKKSRQTAHMQSFSLSLTVCKQFETVAAEFETVAAVAVSCCIRCILVVFCTLVSGRRICTAEVAGSDFSAVWAWSRLPTPVKTFMSWQRIHGMTAWEHGDIIPWLSIGTIVWYYNII